ncbi:hypothetical protein PMALA_056910, partial [Plasmodium malariae]
VGNKRRYNSSDYASELTDLIFSQNRNIQNVDSKKGEEQEKTIISVSFKDLFVSEYFSKLLEIPEAFEELKKLYDIVDLINSRALTPNLRSLDMSLPSHLNFILISLNLPPHEGQINDRKLSC